MFFRKKEERHLEHRENSFFDKVREEMSLLTQWLHYFYKKNDEHDIRIRLLEQHAHVKKGESQKVAVLEKQYGHLVDQVAKTQRRLHIVLEAQEPLLQKLEELEKKMPHGDMEKLAEVHKRISLLEQKGAHSLPHTAKQRIAEKVAKKSKEYIKHTIQALITKYGRIAGLQLREIVVDEQHLCSKSTFYRLLQELENDASVGSLREIKEKVYFAQLEKEVVR